MKILTMVLIIGFTNIAHAEYFGGVDYYQQQQLNMQQQQLQMQQRQQQDMWIQQQQNSFQQGQQELDKQPSPLNQFYQGMGMLNNAVRRQNEQ